MPPFDACRLDPVASVNRVLVEGREARELLSARALRVLALDAGVALGPRLRTELDAQAGSPAFEAVVQAFAARMSTLLWVLRSGVRAARPEWDATWWARWAAAETVWLAGGLAGGAAVAARAANPGGRILVPDDAVDLPLVGAARLAPQDSALVLDFGHTAVKRALAGPRGLQRLPPLPAPPVDASGQAVAESVLDVLRASWAGTGRPPGPVVCSIASYVVCGQPVRTPLGTYARLADVTPDVSGWLGERLRTEVVLVHDGTAAAHAVPRDPRSVVVLLGTSLGVGFPHECPAVR